MRPGDGSIVYRNTSNQVRYTGVSTTKVRCVGVPILVPYCNLRTLPSTTLCLRYGEGRLRPEPIAGRTGSLKRGELTGMRRAEALSPSS